MLFTRETDRLRRQNAALRLTCLVLFCLLGAASGIVVGSAIDRRNCLCQ